MTGGAEKASRPALGGAGGGHGTERAGHAAHSHSSAAGLARQNPQHGYVVGHIWAKIARASQHQLRRPPAWAVDLADLETAERLGVKLVAVKDQEMGRCYWATPETIRRHGFTLDRGHGRQIALPLRWWAPTAAEALRLGQAEAEPVQLKLFVEVAYGG